MLALIDLAIRGTVLLLLAWAGVALLRRRSASLRASLWTAAFAALLALPMVFLMVPSWKVPVLSATEATIVYAGSEDPASEVPLAAAADLSGPAIDQAHSTTVPQAPATSGPMNWSIVVLAGLGLVTSILLIRIVVAYGRMRRIAARSVEADATWVALVDDVRAAFGIVRPIAVRVTNATNVPAVVGISKPTLLLPFETHHWPLDVQRAVVLHELAHVARRDALGQLVSQIACAFYWFVPLAWYGAKRAAAFRERASDDAVISAGVRPSAYAESLMTLAQSTSRALQSEASMAMAESRIHERIAAILSPGARRDRLTWRSAVAMVTLTLAATAGIGAIELAEVERRTATSATASTTVIAPMPSAGPAGFGTPATTATAGSSRRTDPTAMTSATATADATAGEPASDEVPQAAQAGRFCEGRGLDKSSSSIHEDDNERRWTVKLSGAGCSVDLRAEGKFTFNDQFTDIARIDSNGFFRVDVTDRGVRRQLDIESRNGTLTRTWRVDGREQPYDDAARAWFASFLIELDRRTAIGVDIRLPILIRQGGVDAVLKETALMSSDYARSQYYIKLPKATKVTPAETTRILQQAGSLTGSDHYKAELVGAYVANVQDTTVRAALIALVEKMGSDHYQATSIEKILGPGAPGPAEMDVLTRLVPRMSSDHYKTQVLMKVLRAPSAGASHRVAMAQAAASISSDHYAAEVLQTLAQNGLGDDAVRKAFFDAASKISSDHYHGQVLQSVLAGRSANERDLLDVIAQSKSIGSDHYQSEVLQRVARHPSATDRVRTAVVDAAAGMSRHYADQIRRAAGR